MDLPIKNGDSPTKRRLEGLLVLLDERWGRCGLGLGGLGGRRFLALLQGVNQRSKDHLRPGWWGCEKKYIYLFIYLSIHLTICERSSSFAGDHLEVSAKRMEIRKKNTWLYYGFNIEIVWFGGTSILRNLHFESYTSLPPANDRFLRYASRFEPPIHKL